MDDRPTTSSSSGSLRRNLAIVAIGVLLIVSLTLASLYWRLASEPIETPSLTSYFEQKLTSSFDNKYTISIEQTQLEKLKDSGYVIVLNNIKFFDESDQIVLVAPRARLGLELWSLFLPMRSMGLTLENPELNLIYDSDEGLMLSTLYESKTKTEQFKSGDDNAAPTDYDWIKTSAITIKDIMVELRDFTDSSQLTHAGFIDAKINIALPHSDEARIFDRTTFYIFRDEENNDRMTMKLSSSGHAGEWRLLAYIEEDEESGENLFNLDIRDFEPASLFPSLSDTTSFLSLSSPMNLDVNFKLDPTDTLIDSSARITLGAGVVRVYGRNLLLDEAILNFSWYPDDLFITLEPSTILSGYSSAELTGYASFPEKSEADRVVELNLEAKNLIIDDKGDQDDNGKFDRLSYNGWYSPATTKLGIDQLFVIKNDQRGSLLESNGELLFTKQGLGFNYDLQFSDLSVKEMVNLWPSFMAPNAHRWISNHTHGGYVQKGSIEARFEPGTLGAQDENKPFPNGSLKVQLTGNEIEVKPHALLPNLEDASLDIQIIDNNLNLNLDTAYAQIKDHRLHLADSKMTIRDLRNPVQKANFNLGIESDTASLAALASLPGLNLLGGTRVDFKPNDLEGDAKTNVKLSLPLGAIDTGKHIKYDINARLKDFASRVPINGRKFSDGDIRIIANNEQATVSGIAKIDGVKSDVVLRTSSKSGLELVSANSVLSIDQLKEQGFDFSAFMSGKVRILIGEDSKHFIVDIQDAAINFPAVGWTKKRGKKGQISFIVEENKTGQILKKFNFSALGARIQGTIQLDKNGDLHKANFTRFNLQSSDNASAVISALKKGYDIKLTGKQFDARGFINTLYETTGNSNSHSENVRLYLDIGRLIGHGRSDITQGKFDIQYANGRLSQANGAGNIGVGRVAARTRSKGNERNFEVSVSDLGRLLRFFKYYDRVSQGTAYLNYVTTTQSRNARAVLRLQKVIVEDEPALRRFSQTMLQDSRYKGPNDIARKRRFIISTSQFSANITPNAFTNIRGGLSGPYVGGTLRGNIDRKSKTYDLTGTYVPAYALNNILSRLPILGRLLGGREQEGILGITFAVKGPINKPRLKIRPASLLAPGALRHFFEYRAKKK